ncbi:MAG: hypothetical protein HQ445_09070 [Polaromonas sp.]|nr:hypothetical protein [Polaromonas sp.]
MKLQCPHCQGDDLRVFETRSTKQMIFRTRRCVACEAKVITCETVFVDGFIPGTARHPALQAA